ncbi:MAG: DUF2304 domain-containing protein [Myxococcota bacterium]|nr:DUF2304 domain-containing protein [Myxococcota bacterium]
MDPVSLDGTTLREIFLQEQVATSTRVVALVAAVALFAAVLEAVRRRKLLEELTPIWLSCALAILVLAFSFDLLVAITDLIGAWTPSSTVFFLGLAFLMAISLGYAVRISTLSNRVKVLAQELAILRAELSRRGDAHPPG